MFKISGIGGLCCLGGVLLAGYQALVGLMNEKTGWYDITLWDLGGAPLDAVLNRLPQGFIDSWPGDIIYDFPFYQLLIAVGILFLIIGAFAEK